MSRYAKDEPSGFQNSIKTIAIVGAGGTIGNHIVEALLKTNNQSLTAITRSSSTSTLPPGLKLAQVDYTIPSTLIAALQNHDCLIITLSPTAPRDTHSILVQAAAKAGVRYIVPNGYGGDIAATKLGQETLLGPVAQTQRDEIETLGMKWVNFCNGFWYDYSLAGGESRFGFDFDERKITFYDEGETRITSSTLAQVGRAVAKVLSLKLLPVDERDEEVTLSRFDNRAVYLDSFLVSQKEMFESVKRVTNTKDADWTVSYEASKTRYEEGMAAVKKGDMRGFSKLLYARGLDHDDPSEFSSKVHNKLLELPKESLDEATKDGVELIKVLQGRAERMAA